MAQETGFEHAEYGCDRGSLDLGSDDRLDAGLDHVVELLHRVAEPLHHDGGPLLQAVKPPHHVAELLLHVPGYDVLWAEPHAAEPFLHEPG